MRSTYAPPVRPEMDRRSWYMTKADAKILAKLLHDLYFTTQRPKYEIMAAVIELAAENRNLIRERLSHP